MPGTKQPLRDVEGLVNFQEYDCWASTVGEHSILGVRIKGIVGAASCTNDRSQDQVPAIVDLAVLRNVLGSPQSIFWCKGKARVARTIHPGALDVSR